MDDFHYDQGRLFCEQVNLDELADRLGTPLYVYSRHTFEQHYDQLARAFAPLAPLICYSVKSCGNVHLLRLLARRGAGMDIVSGGELHRACLAGVEPEKIVYAGVGKTDAEIRQALRARIGYFNIESEQEFQAIAALAAEMDCPARAALRINPDVYDPATPDKTTTGRKETKFGVDIDRAADFFQRFGDDRYLRLDGLHLHIGSPVYDPQAYARAIDKTLDLIDHLAGLGRPVHTLDLGGGFGADYHAGQSPAYTDYAQAIVPRLKPFVQRSGRVILEPGRTIAANAAVLLTSVLYTKTGGSKRFVIVDTGMHQLIRPALYEAYHFIWPTHVDPEHLPDRSRTRPASAGLQTVDVVGPICETGDVLASGRDLPPVHRGDRLAIFSAGAYGMTMASNYNAMPRPAEVLVDGDSWSVIRRRETYDDLTAPEC